MDSYVDSGFDSKIPPSQSMIYDNFGVCWLIALLENFKSNEELRKYIFENVQNHDFLKGLRSVLEIHKAVISKKDFELLVSIFTEDKPTRSSGADTLSFMINLTENCSTQKTVKVTDKQTLEPLFQIPTKLIGRDGVFGFRSNGVMPLIQICIPPGFFKTNYLDVGKIFLPPWSESLYSTNHFNFIIFNRKANFLIVNVSHFVTRNDKTFDFKGIVIPKTLFTITKDKVKQKYSLTSVLYSKKKYIKYFNHAASFVKRNNKWYDTEFEVDKEYLNPFAFFFSKKAPLISALNDKKKEEVIFNTAEHKNKIFIDFLFYQIEE